MSVRRSCSVRCDASSSGGVRDGLENTCYSAAVCIARGERGCDFYADDLLLAGFLFYLAPCVCACVRACHLCMEQESSCFPFPQRVSFECTESGTCLAGRCRYFVPFPSDGTDAVVSQTG